MQPRLLFILLSIILISCGKENGPGSTDPKDGNSQISQADLNNISSPCANEASTIQLPAELTIANNYNKFEQTLEIFTAVEFSKSLLLAFDTPILPPSSAFYAEVDDIVVFEGDNAYEWTIGSDKYLITLNDNGYTIKFFKNGEGFLGTNFVSLEQSEDCSSFEYMQYAIEDDGDQKLGDLIFKYNYRSDLITKEIIFGTDLYSTDSEEYDIRSFDDLSGDMYIKKGGQTIRSYNWAKDGNGSYNILEEGITVEEGFWTF